MIGERFNACGNDCPRCLRPGTLGPVVPSYDGVKKLDCCGCFARFRVEPASPSVVETLVQIPFEIEVNRCEACNVRIGVALRMCTPCNAASFRA